MRKHLTALAAWAFVAASAFAQTVTPNTNVTSNSGGGGGGTGTVTSVGCTAGSGIACSVANPTGAAVLTISATGATAFSPSSLFINSEKGAWYDPSDLATVFSDSGCTTPAVVTGPVGCIQDKSGNHFDLTATTTARPTLSQDANSKYYLAFNGTTNYLYRAAATSIPIPNHMAVFAVQEVAHSDNSGIFSLAGATGSDYDTANAMSYNFGADPTVSFGVINGTGETINLYGDPHPLPLQVLSDVLGFGASAAINGFNTLIRSNGLNYGTARTSNSTGTANSGGLVVGTRYITGAPDPSFCAHMNFYGLVVLGRRPTGGELSNMEAWMSVKAGLVP